MATMRTMPHWGEKKIDVATPWLIVVANSYSTKITPLTRLKDPT
jgi:hypothetical protein